MVTSRMNILAASTFLVVLVLSGCDTADQPPSEQKANKPKAEPAKKVRVGDNVYLEISGDKRRVLINAEVCLRRGPLEQLLTRKNKKEHEAILAAAVDARKVHEALILAKAKEGEPVRFSPKYRPASGTTIKVTLEYEVKGEKKSVSARSWIKHMKTGKELDTDWVFAGSMLVDNAFDKDAPKMYLANDGDVICIANFESALLDIPVVSAKDDGDRGYEAWEARIPAVGTEVTVILEPVPAAKKAKK